MNTLDNAVSMESPALTNGSGAAAIISAGIGCFVLAVLAIAGDKSVFVKNTLNFYKPTGPLSGVTSVAILAWLFTWGILNRVGARRQLLQGVPTQLLSDCWP